MIINANDAANLTISSIFEQNYFKQIEEGIIVNAKRGLYEAAFSLNTLSELFGKITVDMIQKVDEFPLLFRILHKALIEKGYIISFVLLDEKCDHKNSENWEFVVSWEVMCSRNLKLN